VVVSPDPGNCAGVCGCPHPALRPPAQPEPDNLDALKDELVRRWSVVSLLDVLTEADWLTDFHTEFTTVAAREGLAPGELRKRLLLVLFALGTNIGIRRMVHAGDHGVTEAQLRRARRSYVSRDGLRRAIAAVVNETLRGRDERWWGAGTACASDSKKFGSWESNLMTRGSALLPAMPAPGTAPSAVMAAGSALD
jgi:hypothetical protein